MIIDEQLRENAKIIAQKLVDKMGIEKVALTTSVTIRPETTYYGWVNGQYAKQCALIAVDEIIESQPRYPSNVDWDDCGATHQYYYEEQRAESQKFWEQVKTEIENYEL